MIALNGLDFSPPSLNATAFFFFKGLLILTSIIEKYCHHGNGRLITFNPLIANYLQNWL